MATNRTRRARKRGTLPPAIESLFMIGCMADQYTETESRRLWKQHGRHFLNNISERRKSKGGFAENPFFLKLYGEPETEGNNADKPN